MTMNERIEQAVDDFLQDPVFSKLLNRNAAIALAKHIYKFSLQNQWISVDEELPKTINLNVLARIEDITTMALSYCVTFYDEDGWDGIYLPYRVTHWMPIPTLTCK